MRKNAFKIVLIFTASLFIYENFSLQMLGPAAQAAQGGQLQKSLYDIISQSNAKRADVFESYLAGKINYSDVVIQTDNPNVADSKSVPAGNISKAAPTKKTDVSAKNTTLPKIAAIGNAGIGKPGKIFAETKIVSGKHVCAKKNDKPEKSKKNAKGHIDGECCLDPGETPNSLCYYPQAKYAKFIQKYLNSKK